MGITLVLIDEPLENDQRVKNAISRYTNPVVIDCSQKNYAFPSTYILLLLNIFPLLHTILYTPILWLKFYKKYNYIPDGFSAGLLTSLRTKFMIDRTFDELKNKYADISIDTIHANDLTCGVIGMKLAKEFECNLIYDAHEIEFHRNRKNSILRVVYDVLLEKEILVKSSNLIVVNKPAKDSYNYMYNISQDKIQIIGNNHFTPYYKYSLEIFNESINEVVIVYIGSGINGRKLESLGYDSVQTNITIYSFFLSRTPDVAYNYNWILGPSNYLLDLLGLAKTKRSIMWCCTEDLCLSYKLSLPNKFFQAMAIGIPVIAYKGSYLAEIVQENNLGYIYDDSNFKYIIQELEDSQTYYGLLESIALFQNKLFIEKLEL